MKTPTASLFPVLDNRPIDQWRVTELKEELKRRKLTTKGLKDDLVKRLDEALRNEYEAAEGDEGSNLEGTPQPVIHTEDVKIIDGTPQPLVHSEDIAVLDIASKPVAQTEDIAVLVAQTEEVLDVGSKPVAQTEDIGVLDGTHRPVTNAEDTEAPVNYEKFEGMMHHGNNADEMNVGMVDETALLPSKRDIQEGVATDGADSVWIEETVGHVTSVETTVVVKESVTHEIAVNEQESPKNDVQSVRDDLNIRLEDEERGPPYEDVELKSSDPSHQASEVSAVIGFQVTKLESEETKPPHNDVELNSSDPINQVQVSEVNTVLGFQVKSDSISSDCVSINEKNELKDNIIADNVKLEVDVNPEIVHPSSSNVLSDGSKLHPMDVEEPYENKEQERDDKTANAEMSKKLDSLDVVSSEKLNLDRSSGDDSMEDDTLDNKPIDSKYNLEEVRDQGEKNEDQVMGEEAPIDIVSDDIPTDKKDIHDEIKNVPAAPIVKRKLHDQEVGNNEISKRQRRWNSENLKVPEPQINIALSTTPKDMFPSTTLKRNFSRSDSSASEDAPKERVVPPSPKPPTTSLRIDRFLRPFTLKAVQELLGKTGSVISFWMDHIKTHCYVTYSSVEEAVETRNAVYNLQWPSNGGRLLLAEFVDPQEVKLRVEAPPQSPATPVSTTPTMPPPPPTVQPQAPPRQQIQKQTLPPPPPLPLPPPPPLSNPPQARERLPPPPPPPEKIDPPIVTLDDLFRKTKATPRIYYLPLSDEQVAAKLKQQQQGRNTKQ